MALAWPSSSGSSSPTWALVDQVIRLASGLEALQALRASGHDVPARNRPCRAGSTRSRARRLLVQTLSRGRRGLTR